MNKRIALALVAGVTSVGFAALTPALATNFAVLLGSSERPDADKARDADRKPAEVMAFAGIKAGTKVAELAPGGGYYTRLLSAAVGPTGHVYTFAGRPSAAVEAWAKNHANVTQRVGLPDDSLAPVPVDVVWTTMNYHDFKNNKVGETDAAAKFNAAAWVVLKVGGIYLVNDHEAAPGAGSSVTQTHHRIESAAVIREVEAAGFRLVGKSDLLRHAADDLNKPLRDSERGKTNQFLLKFKKVKR
ncbi:methyltransferase [Novosphingobium sp.]|uniref:class I SAM-dependent methyltransferase n=1 Tax=Novosphingobium sp. TaxID=1874826 RepID=UPI00286D960D|nr:methyltransferase [Novosphingobium sp.]